jgi:hypothetical protein
VNVNLWLADPEHRKRWLAQRRKGRRRKARAVGRKK